MASCSSAFALVEPVDGGVVVAHGHIELEVDVTFIFIEAKHGGINGHIFHTESSTEGDFATVGLAKLIVDKAHTERARFLEIDVYVEAIFEGGIYS